jgi:hypothetical protein
VPIGLAGDDERQCYPIKGQIVSVDAPWIDFAMTDVDSGAYVIRRPAPRSRWAAPPTPTCGIARRAPPTRETIRAAVAQMLPSLAAVEADDCWTGLRPARRAGVRLQATRCARTGALLVHNYGHGGAGFVCSYGCAARVVAVGGAGIGGEIGQAVKNNRKRCEARLLEEGAGRRWARRSCFDLLARRRDAQLVALDELLNRLGPDLPLLSASAPMLAMNLARSCSLATSTTLRPSD